MQESAHNFYLQLRHLDKIWFFPGLEPRSGRLGLTRVTTPSVEYDGNNYEMWYTGNYARGLNSSVRIGYVTSSDGITWTRQTACPVLDIGAYGNWDDYYVA